MQLGEILFEKYRQIVTEQQHRIIALEAGCHFKDLEIGELMKVNEELQKQIAELTDKSPAKKNK